MGNSPRLDIPYPELDDPADVPADVFEILVSGLDPIVQIYDYGLDSAKPAAGVGIEGLLYLATDTGLLYFYTASQRFLINAPPTVTPDPDPPPSPADGDFWTFPADPDNDIYWTFRYKASNTQWVFAYGPPIFRIVTAREGWTTDHAAYQNLPTSGPSVTIPFDGTYDVEIGAEMEAYQANVMIAMSYAIGGTAASDNDRVLGAGNSPAGASSYAPRRQTGLAASTVLLAKYRIVTWSNGGQVFFGKRWMRVLPISLPA